MSKRQSLQGRGVRGFHRDRRGAVLVEFIVAFMPLMITFSSFAQMAQIVTARLMLRHATVVGARAASVISNANNNTPDQKQGNNQDEIKAAVIAALGPTDPKTGLGLWEKTMGDLTVDVNDQSSCDDPYGLVTVRVRANYRCAVPFGNRLVCGLTGTHPIDDQLGFPHQGARYADGGGAKCGN